MPLKDEILNSLGKAAGFQLTREQAYAEKKCVRCAQLAAPKIHTEAGQREYGITAVCEECFDTMFPEDEEAT